VGKYSEGLFDVYHVFDTQAYKEENIKTFPSSFEGDKGAPPFLRFTVVPGGPPLNAASTSGVLLVEIFTAWGAGPTPANQIADILDKHLQRKTVGRTQFFLSSADKQERDKEDKVLARMFYSIPFAHFGVTI